MVPSKSSPRGSGSFWPPGNPVHDSSWSSAPRARACCVLISSTRTPLARWSRNGTLDRTVSSKGRGLLPRRADPVVRRERIGLRDHRLLDSIGAPAIRRVVRRDHHQSHRSTGSVPSRSQGQAPRGAPGVRRGCVLAAQRDHASNHCGGRESHAACRSKRQSARPPSSSAGDIRDLSELQGPATGMDSPRAPGSVIRVVERQYRETRPRRHPR